MGHSPPMVWDLGVCNAFCLRQGVFGPGEQLLEGMDIWVWEAGDNRFWMDEIHFASPEKPWNDSIPL